VSVKLSKMEEKAREVVLKAGTDLSVESIWLGMGREKKKNWRVTANDVMRRVALKSEIIPPRIERKTGLGRGAKAIYGVENASWLKEDPEGFCPECRGRGSFREKEYPDNWVTTPCYHCGGRGVVLSKGEDHE